MADGILLGSGIAFSALTEPEAFAVHLEDVDVVRLAVEDGAGQTLRSEDLGPFIERQVEVMLIIRARSAGR
jgi:hypothetical protein